MSNSGREHRFGEVKGEEDMLLKEMLLVFRLSKKPSSTLWCAWFESKRFGPVSWILCILKYRTLVDSTQVDVEARR
jgi:hypothetical protein